MKHVWFVSYYWATKANYGHGNIQITTTFPITTMEQIHGVVREIKRINKMPEVVILNYVLLRTEGDQTPPSELRTPHSAIPTSS